LFTPLLFDGITIVAQEGGAEMAKSRGGRGGESGVEPTGVKTARAELARVRARFGIDPAIPSRLLARAWTSPSGVVEADEAEFVDALVDCLSVGLPLNAAVASWTSGALARDDVGAQEDDEGELGAPI
jgi:hypothetical protein